MIILPYKKEYVKEIINLFRNTVHHVNCKDYTKEQLNVWASNFIDEKAWHESLSKHYSLIAKLDDKIVGFSDLDKNYLDRLYVDKDYQRQKIATKLVDKIETYAKKAGEYEMITHASITAKPFFLSRGYEVLKEQYVERQKILLKNYIMRKIL